MTPLGATVMVTAMMTTLLVFFSRPLTLAWVGTRVAVPYAWRMPTMLAKVQA